MAARVSIVPSPQITLTDVRGVLSVSVAVIVSVMGVSVEAVVVDSANVTTGGLSPGVPTVTVLNTWLGWVLTIGALKESRADPFARDGLSKTLRLTFNMPGPP